MATYTLTSTKGDSTIEGTLAEAFRAAITMEEELQPSYGVTIEGGEDGAFECRNGNIAVIGGANTEDEEDGHAMLVDGSLMVAWEQGIRTRFIDNVIPG